MDHNPIAIRVFDGAAERYSELFMDTSMYHASFDRFLAALPAPGSTVLELGCGPGNITRYLLDRRPDLHILGTDLAPRMLALAGSNCPEAEFQVLDARCIASLERSFHGIMCGFCLPYLTASETEALFRDAAALLHPRGTFYVSTMEDDPAKSGFKTPSDGKGEAVHTTYYQGEFLTTALTAAGFTVRDVQRVSYPGRDGSPTTDVLINAQRSS
jgi:ubiquinone/menaquinone biosynthesis C-methylase UbiE